MTQMRSNGMRIVLHLMAIVQFTHGISYNYVYVDFPDFKANHTFISKLKYLTFLNAVIQNLYYIVALINDFSGTNELIPKNPPKVRKLKDTLFSSVAFPLSLTVSSIFWLLYYLDRELVLPEKLDDIFPNWLNDMFRTKIVFFVLVEKLISYHTYPKRIKGLCMLTAFLLSYLALIYIEKLSTGAWPYNILNNFDLQQRLVLYVVFLIYTATCYVSGDFLNYIIWRKKIEIAKRKAI